MPNRSWYPFTEAPVQYSAEVRWFLDGPIPDELHAWFVGAADAPPYLAGREAARTDRYLLLPGCRTLGAKLREGKLELKALCTPPTHLELPHGVVGRSASWVKWSYAEPPAEPFVAALLAEPARLAAGEPGSWADVSKVRWMRLFSLDGPLREVPFDQQPQQGCSFELSQVTVFGTQYWSLACEAFGDLALVADYLRQVTLHLFSAAPPPAPLSAANSWSYPAWLAVQL
jgi:hypothetical protein